MTTLIRQSRPVAFTPGIHLEDAFAAYWVRQVTLRLRREICWLWQERNLTPPSDHALPPFTDRTQWILDLARHADVKRHFFETNETAQYLSKEIARTPPPNELSQRGSFSWIVRELDLDNTETFIMTLGLLSAFDNTAGSVIATCLNHPSSTRPTLALAQRLWDEPSDIIRVANSGHVLFHKGVLQFTNTQKEMVDTEWERPFFVPGSVACRLLEISNGKSVV